VVYMSGPSRWAWHGVSAVEAGSCPEFLRDWPAPPSNEEDDGPGPYERWRGWMAGKRINLNVRQMD
jgi:alkylated DNA repair protein alkB homolog 1